MSLLALVLEQSVLVFRSFEKTGEKGKMASLEQIFMMNVALALLKNKPREPS